MKILRQLMILSLMLTLGVSFLLVNSGVFIQPLKTPDFAWSLASLCLIMMAATFYQMQRLSVIEAKDTNQRKIDIILSSLELNKDKLELDSSDEDEISLEDIKIGPNYTNTNSNDIHLS